jgi:hypothetical protein
VYKPPSYDNAKGKCYSYDVLKSICLEVGLVVDNESQEESWEYRGGCFKDDSPTLYERGILGTTYEFDYIPIEVRADDDPFNVAAKEGTITDDSGTDLSFFAWLSWLAFSFALIGAAVLGLSYGALHLLKQRGL